VPVREAEFFIDALDERKFHLGALVLNKVLPTYFLDEDATRVAQLLCADGPQVAHAVESIVSKPDKVAPVLREIGESFLNFQVVAKREQEQRTELAKLPEVVATVPYFETDIYDMGGLLDLGFQVWGRHD
jgi:hypothetical protein